MSLQEQQSDEMQEYYDILANQKLSMSDILDHMTGPVISLVLHIILISFLSSIVVFEPAPEQNEIEVVMKEIEIKPMEEPPEPPEPPEDVEADEVEVEIERPDVAPPAEMDAPVADIDVNDSSLTIDVTDLMGGGLLMEGNNSALTLNVGSTFKMRSADGRKAALSKYGVPAEADKAVIRTLDFFQRTQNEDGSWYKDKRKDKNDKYSVAMTGLATLCYLAHGETPDSKKYGETVMKAIRALVTMSKDIHENGKHMKCDGRAYGHPIATYALAEAYALTKIPMVKEAMEKSLRFIIDGQNKHGSFDYNYKGVLKADSHGAKAGESRSDLSIAGWNFQALKAAYAGGCTIPGIEEAIDKSIYAIKKVHMTKDGGFSYSTAGSSSRNQKAKATMTAVGALCLQLLGDGKSPETIGAIEWFSTKKYAEETRSYTTCDWANSPGHPLYLWYYMTQVLFQASTTKTGSQSAWKSWNNTFTQVLIKEQNRGGEMDGSWDHPSKKNPRIKAHVKGDPYYSTALCCLMLEVYYRYLPTFKLHGGGHSSTAKFKDDADDLGISF